MKPAILALLAAAVSTIEAAQQEMRERVCEPTCQKFEALKTDLNSAIREGIAEGEEAPAAPVTLPTFDQIFAPGDFEKGVEILGNHLGDRIALEVRAAIDEARKA